MKKTKYLVAALLLMGATTTFTSCIDNDEPAGIEELRGAKAELLRAKATVEEAEAQLRLAKAEVEKANAAILNAKAEYQKLQNEEQQIKNDLLAARTEAAKEALKVKLENIKKSLENDAIQLQIDATKKQQTLAEAQRAYELAIKQIEIAEATLSDQEKVTVAALKNEVNRAYAVIYGGSYNILDANGNITGVSTIAKDASLAEKVIKAEEALYNAMMDKAAGQDKKYKAGGFIPKLEIAVAEAELKRDVEAGVLAKLEDFAQNDVEGHDWKAQIEELNDSIVYLEGQYTEAKLNFDKFMSSEEVLSFEKDLRALVTEAGVVGAKVVLKAKNSTVDLKEHEVKTTDLIMNKASFTDLFNKPVEELKIEAIEEGSIFGNLSVKIDVTELIDHNDTISLEPVGNLEKNLDQIDKWINQANDVKLNENDGASAEIMMGQAQKKVESTKKAYEEFIPVWQAGMAAAKGDKTELDSVAYVGVAEATKGYNAALVILNTQIEAYNTAYKAAYNTAFDKHVNDVKANKEEIVYLDKLTKAVENCSHKAYDKSKAQGSVAALRTAGILDVEGLLKVIETSYVGGASDKDKAAAKAQILEKADLNTAKEIASWWVEAEKKTMQDAHAAANTAAAKDKKVTAANTAINGDVKTAVEKAYKHIKPAINTFFQNAEKYYAQVQDEKTAKLRVVTQLADAKEADYTDDFYASKAVKSDKFDKDTKNTLPLYEVVRTSVDDKELEALTLTKFDASLGEAAWAQSSVEMFGSAFEKQAVLPSREELTNAYSDLAEDGGLYGAYVAAQIAVEECEELKTAEKDLETLKADLAKMKADYVAEIQAMIEANLGAELKEAQAAVKKVKDLKIGAKDLISTGIELNFLQTSAHFRLMAAQNLRRDLVKLVEDYLDIDIKNPAKFTEGLQKAILKHKEAVAQAEKAVLAAKKDLQMAQEGKFDTVSEKQRALELVQNELAKAQAEYETALANLNKALEIMAK